MTALRIGSLCSGGGGLDLAVLDVLSGEIAWHAEYEPPTRKRPRPTQAAAKVLAHRWPGVPNHGDITAVDWATVEPVDVLTAGWPCQPWSVAGQRKGAHDERAIWPAVARAIRVVRPRLAVLENVPEIITLGELSRAVTDLAALGYLGSWVCLRADEVGAPHRRDRVFIAAADAAGCGDANQPGNGRPAQLGAVAGPGDRADAGTAAAGVRGARADAAELAARPDADAASAGRGSGWHVTKHGGSPDGGGPAELGRRGGASPDTDGIAATDRRGGPDGGTQQVAAAGGRAGLALLPTPRATDGAHGGPAQRGSRGDLTLCSALLPTPTATRAGHNRSTSPGAAIRPSLDMIAANTTSWGAYSAAIARWEVVLGRPAPPPTAIGQRGGRRLNPDLVDWLMGWPAGWTDVPGVSVGDRLRIGGNGVLRRQASAALRWLLTTDALRGAA